AEERDIWAGDTRYSVPSRRRTWISIGVVAGMAIVTIGGATILYPKLKGATKQADGLIHWVDLSPSKTPMLTIESDPTGATVKIGEQVFTAPYFAENNFPEHDIEISVSMRGYRTWTGSFKGGQTATVVAKL